MATFIARGASWRYLDNGSDQGTAWRNLNFNDGSWRPGRAQLGYGDGDEATVVGYGPDANNKYITTYFRSTFVIGNAPQVTNLLLRLLRDDGAVVYLNGTEVARQNMPSGTVTFATRASISIPPADELAFFPADVNPNLLINGTNIVAVEVHQNGPQTSDMSFDLELIGSFTTNQVPPLVTLTSPAGGGYFYPASNILLSATAIPAAGSIARVEWLSGTYWVGETLSSPFEWIWNNAPPGTHHITARATDSFGLVGTSAPVTIFVLSETAPWPVIIPAGADWKYLDTGTNAGTAWRAVEFDDSTWKSGPAQLGYGDGDEASVISFGTNAANKYITTYFRHAFTITDAAAFTNLYLRILRDDGAVAYVNSVEVYRANMSPGPVSYNEYALVAVGNTDETTYFYAKVNPALLRDGTNVLAVEIHQSDPDSSDVSFDLELSGNVFGPDTSFYLAPGQRGWIRCVDHPHVAYDLYLPPAYSSNGPALPLIYTYHANGGGMVGDFQTVAASLQIIVVGILESQNGVGWRDYIDITHAVSRDVRQRINYDPTALYAGGWSGGGVASFEFSKFCRQEVAGVFSLSGWLAFQTNSVDRYLTNLLVARANGDTDTGANFYLTHDAPHLLSYGVVIRDWSFPGGHVVAPNSVKTECLNWLIGQRLPPPPGAKDQADLQAALWRSGIQNGERERVFRECVNTIMTHPRTYETRQAVLILDELAADFPQFRQLNLMEAAEGNYALDHFYFRAFGAAKAGDLDLYYSALKATTGIANIDTDRQIDFRQLLQTHGQPRSIIRRALKDSNGQLALSFAKDSVYVDYRVEASANPTNGPWTVVNSPETSQPDGTWSVVLPIANEPGRFLRLKAAVP